MHLRDKSNTDFGDGKTLTTMNADFGANMAPGGAVSSPKAEKRPEIFSIIWPLDTYQALPGKHAAAEIRIHPSQYNEKPVNFD